MTIYDNFFVANGSQVGVNKVDLLPDRTALKAFRDKTEAKLLRPLGPVRSSIDSDSRGRMLTLAGPNKFGAH